MPDDMTVGNALAEVRRSLDGLSPTPHLDAVARRYFDHLTSLAKSLRAFGLNESEIDRHLREIYETYQRELVRSQDALRTQYSEVN
jgi:hypothetical protein